MQIMAIKENGVRKLLSKLFKQGIRDASLIFKFVLDTTAAAVPRPSELFYNKLTPLLEAEGLSAHPRQRNQWPTEILRKVLDELMEETPKDLVSR